MPNESTFVPQGNPPVVTIEVGQGTIWALPNCGSARIPENVELVFRCHERFKVSFAQLGGLPVLPWTKFEYRDGCGEYEFECHTRPPEVPSGTTTLPYYKYTVAVGDLTLDPIIIVDKKPQ
jgi:hypothetical protein